MFRQSCQRVLASDRWCAFFSRNRTASPAAREYPGGPRLGGTFQDEIWRHGEGRVSEKYRTFRQLSRRANGRKYNDINCLTGWRRERDSNPRYGFPYTHFPGVRLQPLGHPSVRGPAARRLRQDRRRAARRRGAEYSEAGHAGKPSRKVMACFVSSAAILHRRGRFSPPSEFSDCRRDRCRFRACRSVGPARRMAGGLRAWPAS